MKPTQFIKDHGLEKARELLKRLHELGCPDDMQITIINGMWHRTVNGFTYPHLKSLVESVDLINKVGGIKKAKEMLVLFEDRKGRSDNYMPLFRAAQDYESIYGEEGASHE